MGGAAERACDRPNTVPQPPITAKLCCNRGTCGVRYFSFLYVVLSLANLVPPQCTPRCTPGALLTTREAVFICSRLTNVALHFSGLATNSECRFYVISGCKFIVLLPVGGKMVKMTVVAHI